ncbi:MAG: hypothetical protein EOP90_13145 [Lysobacteraceae bacterium]|nr:MAG: hypothetical protein EOP90_13145 [Xanthomonadaceae bacterium]
MHRLSLTPRESFLPLTVAVAAGLSLFALDVRADVSLSGNATLTADYVWRGTTQTQGDPAVQAGFKATGESGFYGSVWGSNVEFAPETHASSEFDLAVGWGGRLGEDWAIDVNLLHYRYPSTTVDLNWTELNGTLTYAGNYWLSMGWSPEALGSDESGLYTQVGAKFPLDQHFRLEAAVGYYALDEVYDDSYLHGQLSAVWTIKAPLEVRVTAHATDSSAKNIFGEDFAGHRVEAALQASF